MKFLSRKLSYANVVSTLCLFLVLSGGAAIAANQLAKNSVGANQLKKNAVTTAKLKNNAVTGAKIKNGAITGAKVDLGSLGTVPSAANANTVGGQSVQKVFALIPEGTVPKQTIASFAGFTLTANCIATNPDLDLVSPSGIPADMKAQSNGTGVSPGPVAPGTQGDGPLTLALDRVGGTNNDRGETSFSAALLNGTVVSGELGFEDTNSFANTPSCAIYGHVTVGG